MPVAYLAGYGAGIQVHVEDLGAYLAGRERCDAGARMGELFPLMSPWPRKSARKPGPLPDTRIRPVYRALADHRHAHPGPLGDLANRVGVLQLVQVTGHGHVQREHRGCRRHSGR